MKKILFNGFYGYKNSGDDAFVEIASWGNQHFWGNQEPAFFTGESLPETTTPIANVYPDSQNKLRQKISVFNSALDSDYFINAGGSVFSEIRPFSNIAFVNKAGIFNSKLQHGAIGVSIGPFQSSADEKKTQKYLKKLKFLALRDLKSYEYAKSLNLNCEPIKAFDLAALLPECLDEPAETVTASKEEKTIGISICNFERYYNGNLDNEKRRNDFVKDVLQIVSKNQNIHFKFFIFNGNTQIGDEQITLETASSLNQQNVSVVPYSGNVKSVWNEIKQCDFVLSTRLHASIFACYAKVPFMLIEYHRKCSDFLEDVGYENGLRVFDAERSAKSVADDILSILNGKFNIPSNLYQTIERARLNFTEVSL